MNDSLKLDLISRRALMLGFAGFGAMSVVPPSAFATIENMRDAQRALFGDRDIREGRVDLTLPPISENGNSVALEVDVDSPMTPEDHVVQIAIFSPRNPLPNIARFQMGPGAGRARAATRIRLAGSQTLTAVAEMNDGSLWSGSAETVVTLAACIL